MDSEGSRCSRSEDIFEGASGGGHGPGAQCSVLRTGRAGLGRRVFFFNEMERVGEIMGEVWQR